MNKDILALKEAERALVGHIQQLQKESEDARKDKEQEWLQAMRDVRGEYSPEQKRVIELLKENNPAASEAFIRITAVKALAAYGNIMEILSSNKDFPIVVEPTPIPDGVTEIAHISMEASEEPEENPFDVGYDGDGMDIPPGADYSIIGGLKKQFNKLLSSGAAVKAGEATDPQSQIEIHPAQETAANMQKQLQDQLVEMDAFDKLSRAVWELTHLGSGCLKGPMSVTRTKDKWVQDEEGNISYEPEQYLAPDISSVSIWNIYPDPSVYKAKEGGYIIERHSITKDKLRKWRNNPSFSKEAIDRLLAKKPTYTRKDWEITLRDSKVQQEPNLYEIYEYWGYIDETLAEALGLPFKSSDNIQVNAFICDGELIKAVLNPFASKKIPYHLASYHEDPYKPFGTGIPYNNRDTQGIVNSHWRAAQDNLNLAGNLVLEVDKTRLAPGQDMAIYPGKQIYTKGAMGQSIRSLDFKDTSQSHFIAVDRAMSFGDDATGIPRFFTGSGNMGSGIRTASQTSMLMGATALNIKTVVKNIDRDILEPLGQALFNWNMQFNKNNPTIRGDVQIKAGGTSALIQKEVKSQRLMTYAQIMGSNEILNAKTDWDYLAKEIAKANDLDPSKVLNDVNKAKETAMLMQLINGANNEQGNGQGATAPSGQQGLGNPDKVPTGANAGDISGVGGGNIGTGAVPMPGESGFSG